MNSALVRNVVGNFEEPGWDYGIKKSPYARFHIRNDAKYCVYNNRLMPLTQAIDRFEGYWALRKNVALFDVGERPIEIAGPDSEALCNLVFTRDCSKLRVGRAAYAVLCYDDGGIICDGILMRLEQERFWYVQADGPVYSWLVAHKRGLDAVVHDPGSWVAQVQGPASMEVLAAACDEGAPEDFRYFGVARATMGGQPVLLSRTGWTAELGFEFYTLPEEKPLDGEALWQHVLAAGQPSGIKVAGLDAMDIRRIEAGILNNLSDMDATMTPFEAGMDNIVSFEKSEYIGKASLQNARRGRRLFGVVCETAEPLYNSRVYSGSDEIGTITAAAWSPYLERGIGIVCLDESDSRDAAAIEIVGRDLGTHPARIADLPLYDVEKALPRGKTVAQWEGDGAELAK